MTRTLVLLRHGRTPYNHTGRIQGQVDVPLDDEGHAQAARAAAELARLRPAVLWSSDLVRTRETAGHLARATGLEPVTDARLREFHLGPREGIETADYARDFPDEHTRFRLGDFDAVEGGERTADVAARMLAAVDEVLASLPTDDATAVVVSHGAAIRAATTALLGWPVGAERGLHGLPNCAWVLLDDAKVDPDGPARLRLRAYARQAPAPGGDRTP